MVNLPETSQLLAAMCAKNNVEYTAVMATRHGVLFTVENNGKSRQRRIITRYTKEPTTWISKLVATDVEHNRAKRVSSYLVNPYQV